MKRIEGVRITKRGPQLIASAIVSSVFAVIVHAHGEPARPAAPVARTLTREQFQVLPSDAVVVMKGGSTALAGELRAREAANKAARARTFTASLAAAKAKGEAHVAGFEAARVTKLNARNATEQAAYAQVIKQLGSVVVVGPPAIQSIATASGPFEPGAVVFIKGTGFGSKPGKVVMKGLPNGEHVLPPYSVPVWDSNALLVQVPSISGVHAKEVTIEVTREDGKTASKNVDFTPTMVIASIDAKLVKCDPASTEDKCDTFLSFGAAHVEDTFWEDDAVGCDSWEVSVKNGWVIHHIETTDTTRGGGSIGPGPNCTGTCGGPTPNKVSWNKCFRVPGTGGYSGNMASYMGTVEIIGPKGTSWK
ncbi:MAG: hypothetical protein JWP87_1600 [Labilithrix sp.]|nr:hypothetical protein [Labilithrix sp.]